MLPNTNYLGQELAPYLSDVVGCQWVIEPVSRHFFINQDLFLGGIDLRAFKHNGANIGYKGRMCKIFKKYRLKGY